MFVLGLVVLQLPSLCVLQIRFKFVCFQMQMQMCKGVSMSWVVYSLDFACGLHMFVCMVPANI